MKSASLIAAAVVGCVACDSQVTPGYEGEPLLVVRGSIGRVGGEQLDPTLQPAIGWYVKGDDTHLRIEDVRVEGEFPANFTLELLEPPPDHVLMEADGAQIAWGHIIAVQPDRPDEVAQANEGGESAQCDQSNQCQVQRHWCREDDCYRERLTCERSLDPEKEYEDASCTLLSSEGNPELKVSTWDHIKGLSGNYIMLYTSVPFPAGTHLANSFNDNEPIPSGLHLVSLREYTPDELAAGDRCYAEIEPRIVAAHNRQHGTTLETIAEVEDWAIDQPSTDAFDAFYELQDQLAVEAGCPLGKAFMRVVDVRSPQPISIEIAPDLDTIVDWH